jgi:hypothetical protein
MRIGADVATCFFEVIGFSYVTVETVNGVAVWPMTTYLDLVTLTGDQVNWSQQ